MDDEAPITPPPEKLPHYATVAALTFTILGIFACISGYMLAYSADATIKGAIIGTWTALAGAAGQFWLGSSSGGKLKK